MKIGERLETILKAAVENREAAGISVLVRKNGRDLDLNLMVDVGLGNKGLVPVLGIHGGDLHGDVLADLGGVDAALDSEVHEHAMGAAGMDISDIHGVGEADEAADLQVLADGHDLLGQDLCDGHLAAGILALEQGLHVGGIVVQHDLADVLHELLERFALGAEIGLAVDLDHGADAALGADAGIGHALGRDAAGLLRSFRQALFTQPVDSLLHIAVGRLECLLAVHHADVGHLTQSLDILSGKSHGIFSS